MGGTPSSEPRYHNRPKSMEFDNKTEKVRLTVAEDDDEERFYGILDGGNTECTY